MEELIGLILFECWAFLPKNRGLAFLVGLIFGVLTSVAFFFAWYAQSWELPTPDHATKYANIALAAAITVLVLMAVQVFWRMWKGGEAPYFPTYPFGNSDAEGMVSQGDNSQSKSVNPETLDRARETL